MDRRIAFVVQRYGEEVNGGAEYFCRLLAERMAEYYNVEVLTTCAVDYISWENEYPAGVFQFNGVTVRRFPVDWRRGWKFRVLNGLYWHGIKLNRPLQECWMRAQGPYSSGLLSFIEENRSNYDLFVFFTYLYCTTYYGLPAVREKTVLIPTVHDEKPVYLPLFDRLFALPDFFIFLTEEEKEFAVKRFNLSKGKCAVIGCGIDFPCAGSDKAGAVTGDAAGRYLLYAGRIDPGKDCGLLFQYFNRFKSLFNSDLKLLLIGQSHMEIPANEEIVYLGFVPEDEKRRLLEGATAFVLPSRFESFSLAALEAMACGVPVLANGESAVLRGHCRRSGGGICFGNFEEFAAALNQLLSNAGLRGEMGAKGREYVRQNFSWPVIEKKYAQVFSNLMEKAE